MFDKNEIYTTDLLPSVAVIDAILLFRRFGVDVTGMEAEQVNAARRQLLNKHHPDRGGELDTAQSINAAHDLLKYGVPKYHATTSALKAFCRAHPKRRQQVAAFKLCYPEHPEWAWAGYSGDRPARPSIHHNDFTDVNFIKKTMWELSGHSDIEYTIWGFDSAQFRGHVTVFGTPKIFDYMADAMLTWHTKGSNHRSGCRAVFVHNEEIKDFYLIYSDGKYYGDTMLKMEPCSFNFDPQEDRAFVESLPMKLDRLHETCRAA